MKTISGGSKELDNEVKKEKLFELPDINAKQNLTITTKSILKQAESHTDSFTSEIQKAQFQNELINNDTIQEFIHSSFWSTKPIADRERKAIIRSELSMYNHPKPVVNEAHSPRMRRNTVSQVETQFDKVYKDKTMLVKSIHKVGYNQYFGNRFKTESIHQDFSNLSA